MAQIQPGACKDETFINAYYNCDAPINFNPVCGCDGVTYYNECSAKQHGGLLQGNWMGGLCPDKDFFFFLYPNPVYVQLNMLLQMSTAATDINILIIDRWGSVVLRKNIQRSTTVDGKITISMQDVASLPTGLYFFVAYTAKQMQVEKIVTGVY